MVDINRRTRRDQRVDSGNENHRQMEAMLEAAVRYGDRSLRTRARTILDAGVSAMTGPRQDWPHPRLPQYTDDPRRRHDDGPTPPRSWLVRTRKRRIYRVYLGANPSGAFIADISV
jgi:hypothetical protein